MVQTKPQTVKSNFTDLISFFIWKKLAEQTNWQYIKLILNLQAFLIFFQGVEMSKLSFSLIISAFLFQINK